MKSKLSSTRVYALRGYTVKVERRKFFIAPSIAFTNRKKWKGPYKSLQHATTAIARKLQAEFTKRNGGSHVEE
jgi:hypothetical protein